MTVPSTMQALERLAVAFDLEAPGAVLGLCQRPIPELKPGHVLVKMEASPANPSDLMALAGLYATSPAPGQIPGFEGCGRVVAENAGLLGKYLNGKRVSCAKQGGDGLWADYAAVPANLCIPVPDAFDAAQAASFIVNPFTAHALVSRAMSERASCIIQSAGASQVGRGVTALGSKSDIAIISIVRKRQQVAELEALGCKVVLVAGENDFEAQLSSACKQHKPKLFFDAVAGSQTADVMAALPNGSTSMIYGQLDLDHRIGGEFATEALIFRRQRIEGFWLTHHLESRNLVQKLRAVGEVKKLVGDKVFDTTVASRSGLAAFPAAVSAYAKAMSNGKALLTL